MSIYADHGTTQPLPETACAECLAVAKLAAQLEAEARYADRLVDVGVVAHRIRLALRLVAEHASLPDSTEHRRGHL